MSRPITRDTSRHAEEEVEEEVEEERNLLASSQATTLCLVPAENIDLAFDDWWGGYPNNRERSKARELYAWWRRHGAGADDLAAACDAYARDCQLNERPVMYARTFLARKNPPWRDFLDFTPTADGRRHGGGLSAAEIMDQARAEAD